MIDRDGADAVEDSGACDASRWRSAWRVAWLLGLATAFLAPALATGYWSEDLYQSIMPRGSSAIDHTTLRQEVASHVRTTVQIGRFFPLTPTIITTCHYFLRSAWAYKAYIVATGVLDVFLLYKLASRLGGRKDFGGFAACLAVGLIQYRVAVDSSLGFAGQIQLLIAGLLACPLLLQKYLDGEGRAWLVASWLAYFACTLTYEPAYFLVALPLLLLLRWPASWSRRAWLALPYLGAVGFCGLGTYLVRWLYPSKAYWHHPSFDPRAVAMAVVYQVSAGLPLTYFAFDPLAIFPKSDGGALLRWLLDLRTILVALAAFALALACLRRPAGGAVRPARAGIGMGWIAAMGFVLAVFPTPMIAISPYHRAILSPGVGWIPALIQYYGVALILASGLWTLVGLSALGGPRAAWKCVAAAGLVASVVGLTYRANVRVVACFNAPVGSPLYRETVGMAGGTFDAQRKLLEAAYGSGLLDEVPDRSVVQPAREYPFWYDAKFARFFVAAYSGKAMVTVPAALRFGPEGAGVYRVHEAIDGADSGSVVLSKGAIGPGPVSEALRLFVRHPGVEAGAPFRLEGPGEGVEGRALRVVKSGPGWALYALEGIKGEVKPEALRVVFGGPADPRAIAGRPAEAPRR